MANYAGDGRTEAASISARSASISTAASGGEATRGPSTVETLIQKLGPLVERTHRVNNGLNNLGDRAYGEIPDNIKRSDAEVRESPHYGGTMAELFYTIDRMEDAVSAVESSARRIDGLA